jgi:hypothetical protein
VGCKKEKEEEKEEEEEKLRILRTYRFQVIFEILQVICLPHLQGNQFNTMQS